MIKGAEIKIPETFSVEEVAKFRTEMNEHISRGEHDFILNFNECKFIDSTGLGVIVAVYKRCVEAGGTLKLRSLNPNVMKVFVLTRLDKVFEIYP